MLFMSDEIKRQRDHQSTKFIEGGPPTTLSQQLLSRSCHDSYHTTVAFLIQEITNAHLSNWDLFLLPLKVADPGRLLLGVKGLKFASTLSSLWRTLSSVRRRRLAFCRRDLGVWGVSNSLNALRRRWGGETGQAGEENSVPGAGTLCSDASSTSPSCPSSWYAENGIGEYLLDFRGRLLGLGLGHGDIGGKSISKNSDDWSSILSELLAYGDDKGLDPFREESTSSSCGLYSPSESTYVKVFTTVISVLFIKLRFPNPSLDCETDIFTPCVFTGQAEYYPCFEYFTNHTPNDDA